MSESESSILSSASESAKPSVPLFETHRRERAPPRGATHTTTQRAAPVANKVAAEEKFYSQSSRSAKKSSSHDSDALFDADSFSEADAPQAKRKAPRPPPKRSKTSHKRDSYADARPSQDPTSPSSGNASVMRVRKGNVYAYSTDAPKKWSGPSKQGLHRVVKIEVRTPGGFKQSVEISNTLTYRDLREQLRIAFGIHADQDAELFVVNLDDGSVIGCLADIDMTPYATDRQLDEEQVPFKYVFRARRRDEMSSDDDDDDDVVDDAVEVSADDRYQAAESPRRSLKNSPARSDQAEWKKSPSRSEQRSSASQADGGAELSVPRRPPTPISSSSDDEHALSSLRPRECPLHALVDEVPFQLGTSNIFSNVPMIVGTWSWGDTSTWNFGTDTFNEQTITNAFTTALAVNINMFDTAEVYGNGASERLLGNLVATRRGKHTVVVATKFMPWFTYFSTSWLRHQLMLSRERLGVEKIDLYQIHGLLPSLRSAEAWAEALANVYKEGLVRGVGVSNYTADQLRRTHAVLARHGVPLLSNQVEFSLLRRAPEFGGLLQECRQLNVSVLAYSPLGMGRLTGKYSAASPPPVTRHFGNASMEKVDGLVARLRHIGELYGGKTPAQVAINWLLCHGVCPVVGCKSAEQVRENAGALGWRLSKEHFLELSAASLACQAEQSLVVRMWQD